MQWGTFILWKEIKKSIVTIPKLKKNGKKVSNSNFALSLCPTIFGLTCSTKSNLQGLSLTADVWRGRSTTRGRGRTWPSPPSPQREGADSSLRGCPCGRTSYPSSMLNLSASFYLDLCSLLIVLLGLDDPDTKLFVLEERCTCKKKLNQVSSSNNQINFSLIEAMGQIFK